MILMYTISLYVCYNDTSYREGQIPPGQDKWILVKEFETRYLRAAPNVVIGAAIIFPRGAFNGE